MVPVARRLIVSHAFIIVVIKESFYSFNGCLMSLPCTSMRNLLAVADADAKAIVRPSSYLCLFMRCLIVRRIGCKLTPKARKMQTKRLRKIAQNGVEGQKSYAKLRKTRPIRQSGDKNKRHNGMLFGKNTYRGTAVAKWMEKSHIVTLRNDMAFYDGRWLLTVCRLLLFAVFQVFQILQGTARAPMALVICMLDGFSCPIAHIQKAKQ